MRHIYLVLEGSDGAGKTSIRKHLFRRLVEAGNEVLTVIQTSWLIPEHTEVITNARYHHRQYPQEVITAAYVGDKEAMTRYLVEPNLPYRDVIGDRFVASDMVYHQLLWGIPPERTYEAYAASAVRFPDLTASSTRSRTRRTLGFSDVRATGVGGGTPGKRSGRCTSCSIPCCSAAGSQSSVRWCG